MNKSFKHLAQIALIAVILTTALWATSTDERDMLSETSLEARQDRGEVIDDDNDNVHDLTCMCGLCESGEYDVDDSTHYLHSIYYPSLKNK